MSRVRTAGALRRRQAGRFDRRRWRRGGGPGRAQGMIGKGMNGRGSLTQAMQNHDYCGRGPHQGPDAAAATAR
ncbi:MAG: hypothetical protein WDN06_01795 [Asticcacaulis sp.]